MPMGRLPAVVEFLAYPQHVQNVLLPSAPFYITTMACPTIL